LKRLSEVFTKVKDDAVKGELRTIGQSLAEGRELLSKTATSTPALDAEVLLSKALGLTRTQLFIYSLKRLQYEESHRYRDYLEKRCRGMPIAYITGIKEFMSLTFKVDVRCLIPRAETEILVEAVLKTLEISVNRQLSILEIGTGSGCIAITLARYLPDASIIATDISGETLEIARENAESCGVAERITFLTGDLYEPLGGISRREFDVILSNPPYVAENEIQYLPGSVRDYEPACALWTHEAGLSVTRRIIEGSRGYLVPSGTLALEINPRARVRIGKLLKASGFEGIKVIRDLSGLYRVVLATRGKDEREGQEAGGEDHHG
jgi:release factor glutamine methyltransferase